MKRVPEAEGRRWLEQAEEDLEDARFNLQGGNYNLVCFLAQQVAEKALKAYLYFRGEELVTGHSVEELCSRAMRGEPRLRRLRSQVAILDSYYLPTRYPNALPGGIPARAFNRPTARQAIKLAEGAVTLVRALISPPQPG